MATRFSDIYDRAVFRFQDYDFLKIPEESRRRVLRKYLDMAAMDFKKSCPYDLTKFTEEGDEYADDLDMECQEILSLGVAYYWTSFKILDSEKLRNSMSTKEYTFFSPANLLREAQTLRDSLKKEFNDAIINYSYYNGDIASVGV